MAAIYLKHAQHGNKVAISEDEAKADEKNGWERYDVSALLKPPEKSSNTLTLKQKAA